MDPLHKLDYKDIVSSGDVSKLSSFLDQLDFVKHKEVFLSSLMPCNECMECPKSMKKC